MTWAEAVPLAENAVRCLQSKYLAKGPAWKLKSPDRQEGLPGFQPLGIVMETPPCRTGLAR